MKIWVNPYIGHLQVIHADNGPQFHSNELKTLLNMSGIKLETSGVESHNAMDICECYREYLRKIFWKVLAEHRNLDPEYVLPLTVRAMNVTAGRNGLSPFLFFFGVSPRIPPVTNNYPIQRERIWTLSVARSEMLKFMAKQRLATALRRHIPEITDHDLPIGSDVVLYKERLRNE